MTCLCYHLTLLPIKVNAIFSRTIDERIYNVAAAHLLILFNLYTVYVYVFVTHGCVCVCECIQSWKVNKHLANVSKATCHTKHSMMTSIQSIRMNLNNSLNIMLFSNDNSNNFFHTMAHGQQTMYMYTALRKFPNSIDNSCVMKKNRTFF